jgi:hypothetical protein
VCHPARKTATSLADNKERPNNAVNNCSFPDLSRTSDSRSGILNRNHTYYYWPAGLVDKIGRVQGAWLDNAPYICWHRPVGVLIEPIFDNTLLYWYPAINDLAFFTAFDRTIPWYVPLGYAWFFGGTAYLLQRKFEQGVDVAQVWKLFGMVVVIDWLAVSICEWLSLSAFYGNQPFHLVGSPIWFSFTDAAGAFVLATALHLFLPHLSGNRKLWLLVLPTFTYGGTLGSVTAPVSLALNSAWSMPVTWLAGLATMALCAVTIHVTAQFATKTA